MQQGPAWSSEATQQSQLDLPQSGPSHPQSPRRMLNIATASKCQQMSRDWKVGVGAGFLEKNQEQERNLR